jgi:hypothetical protein
VGEVGPESAVAIFVPGLLPARAEHQGDEGHVGKGGPYLPVVERRHGVGEDARAQGEVQGAEGLHDSTRSKPVVSRRPGRRSSHHPMPQEHRA